MKTIPHEVAQAMSLDDFLNALFAAGLGPEHGARVKVESPCGCVGTFIIQLESGDSAGCINKPREPSEVN